MRPRRRCWRPAPAPRRPRPSWPGSSNRPETLSGFPEPAFRNWAGRSDYLDWGGLLWAVVAEQITGGREWGEAGMGATESGTTTASWTALGCLVHLTVTEPGALDAARALLDADLAALDAPCSRFRPDSELAGLDRAAGRPVQVS